MSEADKIARMFNFSPGAILLDVVTGGIGLALFMYGRKAQRIPHLVTGILLMAYPYFVETTEMSLILGVLIGLGFWAALWLGW